MIIIYLKTNNSVNNLISKIDILDLDGYDELIITSFQFFPSLSLM